MSEAVNETTETTETVEAAPKFDYEMIALSSKLNPAFPQRNSYFEKGMTLYVTQKPNNGSVRIAQSVDDLGIELDSVVNFDHATRKGQYGPLTIIGIVDAEGNQFGIVPQRSLALREIVGIPAE